jgi:hypothetical protein
MTGAQPKPGVLIRFSEHWKRNFLWCEGLLALVVTVGLIVWCERYGGRAEASAWLKNTRALLYPAIISAFGSLFGFVITSMAIILTWVDKEKFLKLRTLEGYRFFWPTFNQTVYALGLGTAATVIALVLQP